VKFQIGFYSIIIVFLIQFWLYYCDNFIVI